MLSDGWALAGLALSAFTSATILPGSSEATLLALLYAQPTLLWPALLTASLANTAGGLTSLWLGQRAPTPPKPGRALSWLHRHGAPVLALSWVPLLGDALCVAAGWLRLPWWPCLLWLALGKTARYAVLVWLAKGV